MRSMMLVVGLLLACADRYSAQNPSDASTSPLFEVASVKQNMSGATRWITGQLRGRVVTTTNSPLRSIIQHAYEVPLAFAPFALVGGDEQILAAQFDISARIPDDAPVSQRFAMLKTLLADRFGLRIHTETRQVPIYALTLARAGALGPALRVSTLDCSPYQAARAAGNFDRALFEQQPRDADNRPLCTDGAVPGPARTLTIRNGGGSLQDLARTASGFAGRPVVDATGLTGNYEWLVAFSIDPLGSGDIPYITTAFREQLGLRLDARTGPFDVLVIDSVQMPTPD